MTLAEITKRLADAGIEDAGWEAALLVSHFTGVSRASMLANPGTDYDSDALADAAERRAGRYPLQYILGSWEFMGLNFTVNENCLIPRPDTECVTEAAIAHCPDGGRILDLCTGSGCIAAALLHYTKNTAFTRRWRHEKCGSASERCCQRFSYCTTVKLYNCATVVAFLYQRRIRQNALCPPRHTYWLLATLSNLFRSPA